MKLFVLTLLLFQLNSALAHAAPRSALCRPYQLKLTYANENQRFEDFLKKSWENALKESPEFASDIGNEEYAGVWSDNSLEAYDRRRELVRCAESSLKKVRREKLSRTHQLNYDLYLDQLKLDQEASRFMGHLLALNQLGGVHTDIADTLNQMPRSTATEIEAILQRLETADVKVGQHETLLKEGLGRGLTAPRIVLGKVAAQFEPMLKEPVTESALYAPFRDLSEVSPEQAARYQERAQTALKTKLYPALKSFRDFVVQTYIPQARTTVSFQDLPLGKEWYQWAIKAQTTTTKSADEIHQLGLDEVARITDEMRKILAEVGFKGDLKAFNKMLLEDSRFYYTSKEDLLLGYRDIAKRADAELPKVFGKLPRLPYGVREIPDFKADAAPTAYYMPGSLETGRAGYFEANTTDLKTRPKWGMEALTLHESVPGHHLQIALAQELEDLPTFRKYSHYTAYVEGWALYAESLGSRMGFYQDPYSRYGQLTYEMWRAIRLVVDTGLHSKGWTRDQALKYFQDNLAKSEAEIAVEVDRYIVWPGQALSYKLGQLKILELRKRAEDRLKDKFSIRRFHDAVLLAGALPLTILEKRVDDWIQTESRAVFNNKMKLDSVGKKGANSFAN
ncbi:MAG: DUF885 domain-containing protein [Bdellovibrionales bacterium]